MLDFVFGVFLGGMVVSAIVIFRAALRKEAVLKIDTSDPEGPFLFMEFSSPPGQLKPGETLTVRVDRDGFAAQP